MDFYLSSNDEAKRTIKRFSKDGKWRRGEKTRKPGPLGPISTGLQPRRALKNISSKSKARLGPIQKSYPPGTCMLQPRKGAQPFEGKHHVDAQQHVQSFFHLHRD